MIRDIRSQSYIRTFVRSATAYVRSLFAGLFGSAVT
jgi:hypothetical protein